MKLEEVFNNHFIQEIKKDKKIKISLSKDKERVYITAGMYRNTPHKKECLMPLYNELKDTHPDLATKIMTIVLGSRNDL